MLFATLVRLLLPSWRFFDDIAANPVLMGRVIDANGCQGSWQELLHAPRRTWLHLLWNPAGNRTLAAYSAVERLLLDASSNGPGLDVSYGVVVDIARSELALVTPAVTGARVQFKVLDRALSGEDDLMISEEHPW